MKFGRIDQGYTFTFVCTSHKAIKLMLCYLLTTYYRSKFSNHRHQNNFGHYVTLVQFFSESSDLAFFLISIFDNWYLNRTIEVRVN
jgi:hypothetical protein